LSLPLIGYVTLSRSFELSFEILVAFMLVAGSSKECPSYFWPFGIGFCGQLLSNKPPRSLYWTPGNGLYDTIALAEFQQAL
jgi:hypothetical protein